MFAQQPPQGMKRAPTGPLKDPYDYGADSSTFKKRRVGVTIHVARGVRNVRNRQGYYGFAMKFEPIPNGTEVTFECIHAKWFNIHRNQNRKQFWREFWRAEPLPAVRVTLRTGPGVTFVGNEVKFDAQLNNIPLSPRNPAPSVQENQWYRLVLTPTTVAPQVELERMADANDFEEPVKFTLWRVESLAAGVVNDLHNFFYIHPSRVRSLIAQNNPVVHFVGILNVGQGGCNAVYGLDGHPMVYFDFGRSKSLESRPTSMRPCLANAPTIVLSHWDQDHFELAASFPEAKHVPWVCLPGPTGANTGQFFNSLTHVRVREEDNSAFEEYSWGFILKAIDNTGTTKNKNDAGLAMLVRVQDDSNAPPVGQRRSLDANGSRPEIFPDERYVLLTGDAMCQYIPSCANHDLDGVIVGIQAVHHGSAVGMFGFENCIPQAAPPLHDLPPTVAYTFGINRNTGQPSGGYGHPHDHAVDTYIRRGYFHRIETNTRNAMAPWVTSRSCVLGWRRAGMAPMDGAAGNIAAARGTYDTAVTRANDLLLFAGQAVAQANVAAALMGASAASVVNAVQLDPSYGAVQLDIAVTALIANANLQPTAAGAQALFAAFPAQAWTIAYAVQNDAVNLVNTVAANDNDFPAVQDIRCQNAGAFAALAACTCLACNPAPPSRTTLVAPMVALAEATTNQNAVEAPGGTIVYLTNHGLATGDQATVNCAAANYANVAVTRIDDESFSIAQTTGNYFQQVGTISHTAAAPVNNNGVTITDQGAPIAIVTHDAHYVKPGTQVTLANSAPVRLALHAAHNIDKISSDSYSIGSPIAGDGAGASSTANASGTRQSRNEKSSVTVNDDNAGNVTVTHNGHGFGAANTTKWVDIQHTQNRIHAGGYTYTVVDGNTYRRVGGAAGNGVVNDIGIAEFLRQAYAFANEAVEVTNSHPVSLVQQNNHGLQDNDVVTIVNGTNAVYNARFEVVVKTPHQYMIPAGTGTGAAYTGDVSAERGGYRQMPGTVEDLGNHLQITHNGHGFVTGSIVHITCAARNAYDGFHEITVLDNDTYRVNAFIGAGAGVVQVQVTGVSGAVSFRGEAITIGGVAGNQTATVRHANHGMLTGDTIRVSGSAAGAYDGAYPVTVVDQNQYTIQLAGAPGANFNGAPAVAAGFRPATDAPSNVATPHNSAFLVRQSVLQSMEKIDKIRKAQAGDAFVRRWQARTGVGGCTVCAFQGLRRRN
jgi:hypothetical protein